MKIMVKKIFNLLGLTPFVMSSRNWVGQLISRPKWYALKKQDNICLELGSGCKKGSNGWTTIDLSGADISHDLRMGIPLPSQTVDRIYTSHMFEHIPYKELVVFIDECYRVLKKGGELSVCVPDAGRYIKSYVEGYRFRSVGEGYGPAIVETGSFMDQVNYIAYMNDQHKYMFDSENLLNTIRKSPFSSVRLREFDDAIDMLSRDFESIYASAIK